MRKERVAGLILAALMAFSLPASAQRSRTVSDPGKAAEPKPAPAPATVKAKYEGGIIGYSKKIDGTLTFDDTNQRLLFRDKNQKEILHIPYNAVLAAYPDVQSRRPTAATVAGSVPAPYGLNIPAWFIKKKYRYLTIQFKDPDTGVSGYTSFKIDDKALLASVIATLGEKAELVQRGDAYVRSSRPSEP